MLPSLRLRRRIHIQIPWFWCISLFAILSGCFVIRRIRIRCISMFAIRSGCFVIRRIRFCCISLFALRIRLFGIGRIHRIRKVRGRITTAGRPYCCWTFSTFSLCWGIFYRWTWQCRRQLWSSLIRWSWRRDKSGSRNKASGRVEGKLTLASFPRRFNLLNFGWRRNDRSVSGTSWKAEANLICRLLCVKH